jgi:hypothetical protein
LVAFVVATAERDTGAYYINIRLSIMDAVLTIEEKKRNVG